MIEPESFGGILVKMMKAFICMAAAIPSVAAITDDIVRTAHAANAGMGSISLDDHVLERGHLELPTDTGATLTAEVNTVPTADLASSRMTYVSQSPLKRRVQVQNTDTGALI